MHNSGHPDVKIEKNRFLINYTTIDLIKKNFFLIYFSRTLYDLQILLFVGNTIFLKYEIFLFSKFLSLVFSFVNSNLRFFLIN